MVSSRRSIVSNGQFTWSLSQTMASSSNILLNIHWRSGSPVVFMPNSPCAWKQSANYKSKRWWYSKNLQFENIFLPDCINAGYLLVRKDRNSKFSHDGKPFQEFLSTSVQHSHLIFPFQSVHHTSVLQHYSTINLAYQFLFAQFILTLKISILFRQHFHAGYSNNFAYSLRQIYSVHSRNFNNTCSTTGGKLNRLLPIWSAASLTPNIFIPPSSLLLLLNHPIFNLYSVTQLYQLQSSLFFFQCWLKISYIFQRINYYGHSISLFQSLEQERGDVTGTVL